MCVLGTQITRSITFLVFSSSKPTPKIIEYFGKALPPAIFGMLVVYALKNTEIITGSHGIPELIGIAATVLLHLWKKNMMLSIAGGTVLYMILIRIPF